MKCHLKQSDAIHFLCYPFPVLQQSMASSLSVYSKAAFIFMLFFFYITFFLFKYLLFFLSFCIYKKAQVNSIYACWCDL